MEDSRAPTSSTMNSLTDTIDHQRRLSRRVCEKCEGHGKKAKPLSKKARLRYKRSQERQQQQASSSSSAATTPTVHKPQPIWQPCTVCDGTGLVLRESSDETEASSSSKSRPSLPSVAIVGGGIAGFCLAIACQHRNIPCTVYERDTHFNQRRQGYGLTLQQASKALKHFGIEPADFANDSITSTRHVVHKSDGTMVGEWGMRKWGRQADKAPPKRQNMHIARQALRHVLWKGVDPHNIEWNARLLDFEETADGVELRFQRDGDRVETRHADLLVGADGIRSQVRQSLLDDNITPLRYLQCFVVLGICPLDRLAEKDQQNELLDGATVFQTADGQTRMYMMPYSSTEYMWQLSFPMEHESEAHKIQGSQALKDESWKRCQSWHEPIPQILEATPLELVSGYPVYDRALVTPEQLRKKSRVTLMGDACHPMSPFKGQGANQAMLDALALANSIYGEMDTGKGSLDKALRDFEDEMLQRSAVKVKASAEAAKFLHSEVAIQAGNVTRGAAASLGGDKQEA